MSFEKNTILLIFGNPSFSKMRKDNVDYDALSAIKKTYIDTSYPPLDVIVRRDGMIITLDLPGVNVDSFVVYQQGDKLIIQGRKQPSYECGAPYNFLRIERMYCNFSRIVAVTEPVEASKTKAVLKDGVLCIELYFNNHIGD